MIKSFNLRSRFDDHVSRKAFHLLAGLIVAVLFAYVFERRTAVILTVVLSLGFILVDLLRLRFPGTQSLFGRAVWPRSCAKKKRTRRVPRSFFALGLCWAVGCLPRVIALQSILTLAFMDPVAGMGGSALRPAHLEFDIQAAFS